MALAASDALAAFDLSTTAQLDLSDVLAAVLNADVFFLGRFPVGKPATQMTHSWVEDSLNPSVVTQADGDTALDASDTSLVVSSGEGAKLRIGALLKDVAAATSEVLQVTAISTDTLTVTRGYGSSTGEAHAAAAQFRIIGQPVQQGDETIADISKARTKRSNYLQGFKQTVKIADELMSTVQAGVPDELQHQITYRMMELKRELGMSVYHSVISDSEGSDTVYATMEGVREWVSASSASLISTSETINEPVLNTLYRLAWDQGSEPRMAVAPADQFRKLARLAEDKIRFAPSDRGRGLFVNKFLTETGNELDFVIDRWIQKDELLITSGEKLALIPLQGMPFKMEPLQRVGNARRAMITGRYTIEVRNPTEAHALHTGLSVG